MDEDILCACCHRKIDYDSLPVCNYCGFLNMAVVGDSKFADENARNHRRSIIEKLKDISVVGYEYGWNEQTKKYEQLSRNQYKIADGMDCDGKVVWSDRDFGQWWNENEKKVQVEITFRFGKPWKVTRSFLPLHSPAFWHIGVEVTDDMCLAIYFGNKDKSARSPGIELLPLLSR